MKNYVYSSILKNEFESFLAIRHSQGFKDKNRYVWESLDKYLVVSGQGEKRLSALTVESWLSEACDGLSNGSVELFITSYNAFAKYLTTIGISAYIQDYSLDMRGRRYTPYIFSSDEMEKIFGIADSGTATKGIPSRIQIPMLLRILYGCGLRLGEALGMHLSNVDLENGTLFIRNGKGSKDRLVPMDWTLSEILAAYCATMFSERKDDPYLFESNYKDSRHNCVGHPRSEGWALANFRSILKKAGITLENRSKNERGICPHCLRHTFVVHSFRRQSMLGVDTYRALPLIPIYLGHNSLTETQSYVHLTTENSEDIVQLTSERYKGIFPEVPQ